MRNISYPMRDIRFPSGLRVLAEQDTRAPVVGLVLVVGAGSSSDPPGKEGLAHYVEHLAFRSRPFGNLSVARMLDKAGAGQWNAFTSLDETVYWEIGPKEALGSLLQLEGTRMALPVAHLAAETIPVELNVVRNELRQRSETGFVGEVLGTMQSLLFPPSHPYARPVGGTHASLSNINADDVTAFLDKHYRPDNMTLLVIGDIELDSISTLVEQSLPKQLLEAHGKQLSSSRIARVAPEPPAPPPARLISQEAAVATPELWIGWSLPRAFDSDAYLVNFVETVVGGAVNASESEDEDINFVDTAVVDGKDASMLLCRVVLTSGGHPEKSYQHVLNALSHVWTRQVTTASFKNQEIGIRRQQRRAVIDMVLEAEDISQRGVSRARITHFTGDPTVYSRAMVSVMNLQPSQIVDFAEKYVNRDRARAVFFRPPKGGGALPESSAVQANTVEEEDRRPVRADTERLKTIVPGIGASSFVTMTLENGLDVVIAPRPGLPIATAHILFYGGEGAAENLEAATAGIWLQQSSATWHGPPEDLGAQWFRRSGKDATVYAITGSSGNASIMLGMIAERVRSFTVDSGVWVNFERNRLPYLQAAETQPEFVAERNFRQALFGPSGYGRTRDAQRLGDLNASKAQAWLDATHVPNNAVLVVVGEIDPDQIKAVVKEVFGDWKQGAQPINTVEAQEPTKKPAAAPALVTTHRPDATQAQIRFGCLLPPVRQLATDVRHDVGAALLTEHIGNVLRQQAGVTYGLHAQTTALRGGTSYLQISGAVENAKLGFALSAIRKSLDNLAQIPTDAQGLARMKLKFARRWATAGLSNQDIATELLGARSMNFSLTSIDNIAAHIADITPEQLQEDFQACLAGRPVLSLIGDEPSVRTAFNEAWAAPPR